MTDEPDLETLLSRPAILAAVAELGLASLGVEDVLHGVRRFGAVRVEVDATGGFACVLEVPGEDPQRFTGPTVLHAALACWAHALESAQHYADAGIVAMERFLARSDDVA